MDVFEKLLHKEYLGTFLYQDSISFEPHSFLLAIEKILEKWVIRFVAEKLESIDLLQENKIVTIAKGFKANFDELIIAAGSATELILNNIGRSTENQFSYSSGLSMHIELEKAEKF